MVTTDALLCRQFAKIIGGQPGFAGGKCVATITRGLSATVLGKKFTVTTSFSFESKDKKGQALCLGRVALLQKETQRFIDAILKKKIIVSSIHNEWLFDHPNLIYVNIEAVTKPLVFATGVKSALNAISSK